MMFAGAVDFRRSLESGLSLPEQRLLIEPNMSVVCNPFESFSSLTILLPLWFIITSVVFFYLS